MNYNQLIQPETVGWVQANHISMGIMCYGIVVDAHGSMIAASFAGRQTSIVEFKRSLAGVRLSVKGDEHNIDFQAQAEDSYQIFDAPLPHGQGTSSLYLHKAALLAYEPVLVGDLKFCYVWGHKDQAYPYFPWWEERVQDAHRIPFLKEWDQALWNMMIDQGWVQTCTSIGFANLWEISVSSEEWQNLIIDNLHALKEAAHEN